MARKYYHGGIQSRRNSWPHYSWKIGSPGPENAKKNFRGFDSRKKYETTNLATCSNERLHWACVRLELGEASAFQSSVVMYLELLLDLAPLSLTQLEL